MVTFVDDTDLLPTNVFAIDNELRNETGWDSTTAFFTEQPSYGLITAPEGAIPTPKNYAEAMASRFAAKWKESMEREIRELIANDTWE